MLQPPGTFIRFSSTSGHLLITTSRLIAFASPPPAIAICSAPFIIPACHFNQSPAYRLSFYAFRAGISHHISFTSPFTPAQPPQLIAPESGHAPQSLVRPPAFRHRQSAANHYARPGYSGSTAIAFRQAICQLDIGLPGPFQAGLQVKLGHFIGFRVMIINGYG